jgi:hypothetical protein
MWEEKPSPQRTQRAQRRAKEAPIISPNGWSDFFDLLWLFKVPGISGVLCVEVFV